MAAKSPSKPAMELFAREFAAAGTSMAPGTTGLVGGRPTPTPVIRLFSFLLPKREVPITLQIGDNSHSVEVPLSGGFDEGNIGDAAPLCRRAGHARLQSRAADPPGAWPQRRQGRQGQHRPHRAQARVPAAAEPLAHARARGRALCAQPASARRALRPARRERDELPAARRAGRRRHGVTAHRQPGQVFCAGAAGDGRAGARRPDTFDRR